MVKECDFLMKNPNGYGSIIKLSGKRRRPFAARITTGYDNKGKQIYKYLGYYETRKEAMQELSMYSANPYDVDLKKITLREIYDRFIQSKKNSVSVKTLESYSSVHSHLFPLMDFKISDIKTAQLQKLFDETAAKISTGSLKVMKTITAQIFRYAMKLDIIDKNYCDFITLPRHQKVLERKIFTEEEIAILWANIKEVEYVDVILILIYTGMRINELLKLKKTDVDIVNCTLTGGSKTDAGKNRVIPIHSKILPLIKKRMGNKTDYLVPNKTEKGAMHYITFRRLVFIPMMEKFGMEHTLHDTRHTFATMISDVSDNETAITGIIGHTNISMTKKYTHTNIEKMKKEIEKIN